MIWHPPFFNRDRWYVLVSDHAQGEEGKPAWRREWKVALEGPASAVSASWVLMGHGFGLGATLGRNGLESDLGLDVHLGRLLSLWLRVRAPWLSWARVEKTDAGDGYDYLYARHTGLRLHPWDGCLLQVQIEDREGTWTKGQPWWRSMSLTAGSLIGPSDVARVPVSDGMTVVPLPEGAYDASFVEEVLTWSYRRWPGIWVDRVRGRRSRRDVYLTIEGGIPVEGKGESSYDCGMDGLFGCGGSSVEEAVANAVRHVLYDRKRYGGPHNLPRPMTVQEAGAR